MSKVKKTGRKFVGPEFVMTDEMRKRYEKSLESMPGPINLNEIKQDMDLRGIMAYARAQGKHVADLSDEEKARFVHDKK